MPVTFSPVGVSPWAKRHRSGRRGAGRQPAPSGRAARPGQRPGPRARRIRQRPRGQMPDDPRRRRGWAQGTPDAGPVARFGESRRCDKATRAGGGRNARCRRPWCRRTGHSPAKATPARSVSVWLKGDPVLPGPRADSIRAGARRRAGNHCAIGRGSRGPLRCAAARRSGTVFVAPDPEPIRAPERRQPAILPLSISLALNSS